MSFEITSRDQSGRKTTWRAVRPYQVGDVVAVNNCGLQEIVSVTTDEEKKMRVLLRNVPFAALAGLRDAAQIEEKCAEILATGVQPISCTFRRLAVDEDDNARKVFSLQPMTGTLVYKEMKTSINFEWRDDGKIPGELQKSTVPAILSLDRYAKIFDTLKTAQELRAEQGFAPLSSEAVRPAGMGAIDFAKGGVVDPVNRWSTLEGAAAKRNRERVQLREALARALGISTIGLTEEMIDNAMLAAIRIPTTAKELQKEQRVESQTLDATRAIDFNL